VTDPGTTPGYYFHLLPRTMPPYAHVKGPLFPDGSPRGQFPTCREHGPGVSRNRIRVPVTVPSRIRPGFLCRAQSLVISADAHDACNTSNAHACVCSAVVWTDRRSNQYSRATLIGPPCAKPAEGSSSWKVPLTVLLVLQVIASSRQKAVQASERGPVHGKAHLAKGPISVAPL